MKEDKNVKKVIIRTLTYFVLILGAAFCIIPLLWMVRSSLMNMTEIFAMPPKWIPSKFMWENYKEVFDTLPFGRYFLNSFVITVGCVVGTMLTSSICAYGLARIDWKGRNVVFACIISSMMLPFAVTLIPIFLMWRKIGIVDSLIPLIVPAWFGGGAFYIFLLRQFYMGIPRDFDEAAYLDGATHIQIFSKIILPITKPAMAVVGMFAFLNAWNDFLGPLVYLSSEKNYTVALGLQLFTGSYRGEWNLMMAAACLVLIPVIIIFAFGQRYMIEGITMSGVKG
ncbi:carbohydrate ABC transporter permease [Blautia liquoris]|uniref:Carbohydrate ABC transporter permease n=1 Tax=Blautia liquoris TaxID=2779518 RepID=A0A7M2RHJ1_9FIRM|nr:carbohydrate ABC transporter permease [Blautia liquoris]QOV18810.1 carbohydrate ABC transporter permease [Blautia liquoris]